jgi:hypothetical protein
LRAKRRATDGSGTFDAIHRLIRRGHEIRGHLHAGGLVRRGVRLRQVGNRHRRILILGDGFERLAGDLAAQILGNRNAQHQFAAHLFFGARQLYVSQLQQRFGGIAALAASL